MRMALFVANHGWPFRHDDEDDEDEFPERNRGCYLEFLDFIFQDNEPLKRMHRLHQDTYASPQAQDQMIGILSGHLIKKLLPERLFSISIDRTTPESSYQLKMALTLRYVTEDLAIQE